MWQNFIKPEHRENVEHPIKIENQKKSKENLRNSRKSWEISFPLGSGNVD